MDAATAAKQAAAGLFPMVQQQAAMMGYVDLFFLLRSCSPHACRCLIMKKAPKGRRLTRGQWRALGASIVVVDILQNVE
jgi:hypothetical protein